MSQVNEQVQTVQQKLVAKESELTRTHEVSARSHCIGYEGSCTASTTQQQRHNPLAPPTHFGVCKQLVGA